MGNFSELSTEKFRIKMQPAARLIYEKIFKGCNIEDLREDGVNVHVLDQEFGIDCLAHMKDGQWLSIQEKYRKNNALHYLEFTQEYKNAVGTVYENDGEWFKLGAQLYFYGWANKDETDFEKWFLMDISKYKMLVSQSGGIKKMGVLKQNSKHGKASFYAIPVQKLESCFVTDYRKL